MKKIITLLLALLPFVISAQDNDIISKMTKSKSIEDLRFISDKIASQTKTKFIFFKQGERKSPSQTDIVFYYIPDNLTPDELNEFSRETKEKCLVILFGSMYEGENKDLEVKGQLVYFFRNVSGKYLDIYPFWTSTFYPNSTKEQILEDYKLKEYRVNKDLKYTLSKTDDIWSIEKWY